MELPVEERCTREDIERAAGKLVACVEALLDFEDTLSAQELERLASVVKAAAALLGVRPELDDEEQRAQIKVLLARAGEGKSEDRSIVVRFEGDAEAASI